MSSDLEQETTEPRNTGPWLADDQSRDLNNELWLAVYLIRSVPDLEPILVTILVTILDVKF